VTTETPGTPATTDMGGRSMTLVEFLTAMLDRAEAPTWTLSPYACEPGCCAPAGWVGSQCRYCDPSPVYGGTVEAMTSSAEEHAETIHQRSRVLRDVEAKRRIIELHSSRVQRIIEVYSGQQVNEDHDTFVCAECGTAGGNDPVLWPCETLRLLALPYADHEDYNEEWRP
jgi:hypothetical protein